MYTDWNPYKIDKHEENKSSDPGWNLDPRNESYYLGKINKPDDTDLDMRYYTDGVTGRYYRRSELIPQKENTEINKDPFKNNSLEGKRKKNFSFRFLSKSEKNKK